MSDDRKQAIEDDIQSVMRSQNVSRERAIAMFEEAFRAALAQKTAGKPAVMLDEDDVRRAHEALNLRQPIPVDIQAKLDDPRNDLWDGAVAALRVRKSKEG